MYKMDMSGETAKKVLLPEGWRDFEIVGCKEQKSKAGNDMFVFEFLDEETKNKDEVYAIATKGKRWFLKQILSACKVPAAQDGVYEWEISNVIGKKIKGKVVHEDNSWTNAYGEIKTAKKHKIVEIDDETIPF